MSHYALLFLRVCCTGHFCGRLRDLQFGISFMCVKVHMLARAPPRDSVWSAFDVENITAFYSGTPEPREKNTANQGDPN